MNEHNSNTNTPAARHTGTGTCKTPKAGSGTKSKAQVDLAALGHLRIGPIDVPVYSAPTLVGAIGCCRHDDNPVILVRDPNSTTALWTILHEAIHMLGFQLGIKLSERDTLCLDNALSSLLRTNPAFFTALLAQVSDRPLPMRTGSPIYGGQSVGAVDDQRTGRSQNNPLRAALRPSKR